MKYAIQRCCTTPIFLRPYELSTDAVLTALGVETLDGRFNCCGYPLKNTEYRAHMLASARNLALTGKTGLDLLTFCNCCYGTLKRVDHTLREGEPVRREINDTLQREGLRWEGQAAVRHLLEVLFHDVGVEVLREKQTKTIEGLKVAVHYGCHIVRPRDVVRFESPGTARIFDQLVDLSGASRIPWSAQLECCGSPLWGVDDEISMTLAERKIQNARASGAAYLCLSCSYCQLQFDRVQKRMVEAGRLADPLPSILITQLLGLPMGLDPVALGMDQHEMDLSGVVDRLVNL
jgi:heterodisulfide reductase subunit B